MLQKPAASSTISVVPSSSHSNPETHSLPLDHGQFYQIVSQNGFTILPAHVSGRKIWINFEAPQQYIRHINPWKKCRNLMQFSKYLAEPFLRPLRSKNRGQRSLRLQPRNFEIIPESLAANLKKLKLTSL